MDLNLDQPLPDLSGATGARVSCTAAKIGSWPGSASRESGGAYGMRNLEAYRTAPVPHAFLSGLDIANTEPVAATLSQNSHLKFWRIRDTPYMSRIPFRDENGEPLRMTSRIHTVRRFVAMPCIGSQPARHAGGSLEIRLWRIPKWRWCGAGTPAAARCSRSPSAPTEHDGDSAFRWLCARLGYRKRRAHREFPPEAEEACYGPRSPPVTR